MSKSLAASLAAMLALSLAGFGESPKPAAAPPPPAVTVAKPTKRTIIDYDEYVGRFVPIHAVEVRARVSGYLDKIHFQDGQIVDRLVGATSKAELASRLNAVIKKESPKR